MQYLGMLYFVSMAIIHGILLTDCSARRPCWTCMIMLFCRPVQHLAFHRANSGCSPNFRTLKMLKMRLLSYWVYPGFSSYNWSSIACETVLMLLTHVCHVTTTLTDIYHINDYSNISLYSYII